MFQLLIVDAEEDLLWALSKNLFKGRKDVKIRTAASGEEALEELKKHRIDLLITDTRVGGEVDGFNLILRAKDLAPTGKLVVMTAFSTDGNKDFSPSLGVAHFINKPFDITELRELVTDVLDGGPRLRGVMNDLALADILTLLCLCNRTVLLHLNHRGRRGRLEVVDGALRHAEFLARRGPEAVWTMLGLKQGDIFMQGDFNRSPTTVEMPWQELLARAAAWLEENGLPEDPHDEVDIPVEGWDDEDAEAGDGDEARAAVGVDDNPLGFSADELREMVMDDAEMPIAPPLEAARPSLARREPTLPRAPMLRPTSQMGAPSPAAPRMAAALPPAGVTNTGRLAATLDEVVRTLSEEIPSFIAADIVHIGDGASVASQVSSDAAGFDHEAAAAFYGELVRTGLRAASAFGEADLESLQIATENHYILARAVPGSPFAQLVTLGRDGNLGIARVVMRRLDALLSLAVSS